MKRGITIVIFLIISIFILGYFLGKSSKIEENMQNSFSKETSQKNEENILNKYDSPDKKQNQNQQEYISSGCKGSGAVNFTASPRPLEQLGFILPMGLTTFQHITPIDHGYFYPPNWKPEPTLEELKDVSAPADGIITEIQRMPDYFRTIKNQELKDYRLVLHHTCTFYSIYIHLYQLSPKIEKEVLELKQSQNKRVSIQVKAGEIIGKANAFDFSVHNDEITLNGFITPDFYKRESWKIHTVDFLDYFTEPLKSQLLEKNVRKVIPRGGKIDYDKKGRLIGNWFVENTNGYQGIKQPEYWETHLAILPNAFDPSIFIISIGDFPDNLKQFAIKGNSPNPEEVSKESGIIKYELVNFYYIDEKGNSWDSRSPAQSIKIKEEKEVKGILLVKVLENEKLKVEVIQGKTASQIQGFTSNAKMYER